MNARNSASDWTGKETSMPFISGISLPLLSNGPFRILRVRSQLCPRVDTQRSFTSFVCWAWGVLFFSSPCFCDMDLIVVGLVVIRASTYVVYVRSFSSSVVCVSKRIRAGWKFSCVGSEKFEPEPDVWSEYGSLNLRWCDAVCTPCSDVESWASVGYFRWTYGDVLQFELKALVDIHSLWGNHF